MKKIFILFLTITFLFVQASFAEEKVGSVKTGWRKFLGVFKKPFLKPEKSPLERFTKEEILRRIKYMLETSPEIADFIPELKDIDLEKLDKENLMKIHNRINIERIRIQTERMERQLETIRASERIPKPPQDYTAPAMPKTPRPPSSPPEVPAPPASTRLEPSRR